MGYLRLDDEIDTIDGKQAKPLLHRASYMAEVGNLNDYLNDLRLICFHRARPRKNILLQ